MGELYPRLLRRLAFVALLLLLACSSTPAAPPSPPRPMPGAPSAKAARERPPCDIAAELRARVPRLLEQGKLHRTALVIDKANRLCPTSAKETWAAEVEVLAELGRYAEARALMQRIGSAPDAPEAAKQAAKAAAEKLARFDKAWPGPEAVTAEMRKAHERAETAAAEGKLLEAMALYEQAWEAWPLNGQALVSAGFAARSLGKKDEAQRLFDRAVATLERRAEKKLQVDVPNGFSPAINSVAWSPNGKRLAVAHGNAVTLLDTATWRERAVLLGHTSAVRAVAFSPDGQQLASGSGDKTVRLWDAATGAPLRTLEGHTNGVHAVAFSPSNALLASASRDDSILLWRLPDATALATLRAIANKDASYLFTPTGHIDFLGTEACAARALAVCRIGPYSLPFDVCEERTYSPGLSAKILAGDLSYLDPEAESPPLTCAPSAL
jgi:tetratricopeptide (TPR) repeat protein